MSPISLVLLVFNAWLAVLLCNAENGVTVASTRVDAEQDPFQSVTVDAGNVAPTSVLFDSCLTASLTMSVKFYSIVAGVNNVEFVRYVPDSTVIVKVPWTTLNATGSIVVCADAAADAGYPMFTYDGTTCLVVNNSYDTTVTPACDADQTNAVFINSAATLSCKYPKLQVNGELCFRVFLTPSYTIANVATTCGIFGLYHITGNNFDAVVAALKLNGYTSTPFLVDSTLNGGGTEYKYWTNASYFVTASDVLVLGSLYMDPAYDFRLKVDTTKTVRYGLLCMPSQGGKK